MNALDIMKACRKHSTKKIVFKSYKYFLSVTSGLIPNGNMSGSDTKKNISMPQKKKEKRKMQVNFI